MNLICWLAATAAVVVPIVALCRTTQPAAPQPYAITDPVIIGPTPDVSRYYPERAQRMGVEGDALTICKVGADGSLGSCEGQGDGPSFFGFGAAALKTMPLRKVGPVSRSGKPVYGEYVLIFTHFGLPGGDRAPPPSWSAQPSSQQVTAAYASPEGKQGFAWSACLVADNLSLKDCQLTLAWPIDHLLIEAPAKLWPLYRAPLTERVLLSIGWDAKIADPRSAQTGIPIALLKAKSLARDFHWRSVATLAQVEAVRPAGLDGAGGVELNCQVGAAMALNSCAVAQETPANKGLAVAALKLVPYYRYQRTIAFKITWPAG
ncbi:MAG: energy transducer TonB [Caulobacteraceae bacterium]